MIKNNVLSDFVLNMNSLMCLGFKFLHALTVVTQ